MEIWMMRLGLQILRYVYPSCLESSWLTFIELVNHKKGTVVHLPPPPGRHYSKSQTPPHATHRRASYPISKILFHCKLSHRHSHPGWCLQLPPQCGTLKSCGQAGSSPLRGGRDDRGGVLEFASPECVC